MRKNDPTLLILIPTLQEAQPTLRALEAVESWERVGLSAVVGRLEGVLVECLVSGVGLVNAARATTLALERREYQAVLLIGIAGAYPETGIPVGSVVCATEEIYGDHGVLTPQGWSSLEEIHLPLLDGNPPLYHQIPLDAPWAQRVARWVGGRAGPFLTLSTVTGSRRHGEQLYARFRALCENMEGAAVAHVCRAYGMPFLELRGISNWIVDRDRSAWKVAEAVQAVSNALQRIVRDRLVPS